MNKNKIIEQLKKEGKITAKMVKQIYQLLLSLTESQLGVIAKDKNIPVFVQYSAKELLSKNAFDVMEKMLDRAHGKATQVNKSSIKVDIEEKTDEELNQAISDYEKRNGRQLSKPYS